MITTALADGAASWKHRFVDGLATPVILPATTIGALASDIKICASEAT
jgi:hypothetical protein